MGIIRLLHLATVCQTVIYILEGEILFGLFGKKKPITAMDNFIEAIYGRHPPPKRAILAQAFNLAHVDLLRSQIDWNEVVVLATQLDNGPIPYSTHDLAISVALNFYKKPENIGLLRGAHLEAQECVLKWQEEKKVVPILAQTFDDTLRDIYKPHADENQQDFIIVHSMRQLTDLAASQGLIQSKEEAVDYLIIFKERIRNVHLKGNSVTLFEVESAIEEELEPIFQSSAALVNRGMKEELALAQCVVLWYKNTKTPTDIRIMLQSEEYQVAMSQVKGTQADSWRRIGEREMLGLVGFEGACIESSRADARDMVVKGCIEIAAVMPEGNNRQTLETASELLTNLPVFQLQDSLPKTLTPQQYAKARAEVRAYLSSELKKYR